MGARFAVDLGLVDEELGFASDGTTAKASGTGLWAASEPRMLKSQAIESGCVKITASALSRRRVSCSWASFSGAGLPA